MIGEAFEGDFKPTPVWTKAEIEARDEWVKSGGPEKRAAAERTANYFRVAATAIEEVSIGLVLTAPRGNGWKIISRTF